jgi:hypothetical protein
MKTISALIAGAVVAGGAVQMSNATSLLTNGNLDVTYDQEIVPGFFLPKPANWINEGTRAVTGPYEDEMSSEPWAGPSPTPVTTDGIAGSDWGVFFKPFSGGGVDGAATGHLYQDNPASPGVHYALSGWAGAEANVLMLDAELALEFRDAGDNLLESFTLSLLPTLTTPNGLAFSYKQYTVEGTAPVGTSIVRSRVSMIGGTPNPAGGGQAFVVDDFELITRTTVPEHIPAGFAGPVIAALFGIHRFLRKS